MPYLGNTPATQFSTTEYQDLTGGSGTSFTLDHVVGTAQEIEVFVNNVRQEPGVAYTVSGTTLTMTGSVAATDDFYVVFQGKANSSVAHPSNTTLVVPDGTASNPSITNNGDTNTGIFFPAADTIGFAEGGSEAMRIDSSGNLLVGTTDTNPANDASGTGVAVGGAGWVAAARDGDTSGMFNRLTSDGNIVTFHKDGSTVGSIGSKDFGGGLGSRLLIGEGDTALGFQVHVDNSITPIKTDGGTRDNVLNLGAASHRFKDLYLSGGVYLGGTGSANKLDDYEEGTWTPSVTRTTTAPTITYGNQSGQYVKIGNVVYVVYYILINTVSGGSGNVQVSGLPFTPADENVLMTFSDVGPVRGSINSNFTGIGSRAANGNFEFRVFGSSGTTTVTTLTTGYLLGEATYRTTA